MGENISERFITSGEETEEQLREIEWYDKFKSGELSIPEYIELGEWYLKNDFGVENLTTIEKWWLKKVTEEIVPNYKNQRKLSKEGKVSSKNAPQWPNLEIASMWLNRVYGMDFDDINQAFSSVRVIDKSTPNQTIKYDYPHLPHLYDEETVITTPPYQFNETDYKIGKNPNGESLYDRIQKLTAEGKQWGIDWEMDVIISEEFKKYLTKLREESHKP